MVAQTAGTSRFIAPDGKTEAGFVIPWSGSAHSHKGRTAGRRQTAERRWPDPSLALLNTPAPIPERRALPAIAAPPSLHVRHRIPDLGNLRPPRAVAPYMRAITYHEFGSADVLSLTEIPEPHIGPDTLIIAVRAAGLNPVDYKVREGFLEPILDAVFPIVPGWDVAGVVLKTGIDTPEFVVGDEVYAYARRDALIGGTLAEQVAVPVRALAHKPRSLGFEEAAAVPLTGLTALQSVRRAGVSAGDRVLIHGGAGGVGSFGVQLAVVAGATVVATASASNHDYLASLGATGIAYGDGLVERALDASPGGYDVILDFAGGASLDSTPDLLKPGGRVVSIADRRAIDLGGIYLWVRPDAAELAELAGLIDAGKVRVELSQVFDLADAADAYRALEDGHVRGKVVVRV